MKKLPLIAAVLASSMLIAGTAQAGNGNYGQGRNGGQQQAATELSTAETADLRFMREEEKLARDVYLTMDEYWGDLTPVFANIAMSEEIHTSTVDYILDKYGVEDPVINDTVGVFTNQGLQELYDQLVAKGRSSFIDALYVGGLIEEKDMKDILAAINATDERAIIIAYSNLLDGSKNHLRAFVRVIEAQGLVYEAQYLDDEEVQLILNDRQ